MVSDLLLAIREIDKAIHLQKKLWFAGLCKWWGTDQKDPGALRLQCLQAPNKD